MLSRIKSVLARTPISEPSWIEIARRELGVREVPGSRDNPRIIEYHRATRLMATEDEVPWCASFMNWVLEQAKMKRSFSAAARSFLGVGQVLRSYRRYAMVVFRRGGAAWQGHVGFAMAETRTHVQVLGGNQGDKVSLAWFPKSSVLGYRWPEPE